MKGKKPTVAQRRIIEKHLGSSEEWLVLKCPNDYILLVNRENGEKRKILL